VQILNSRVWSRTLIMKLYLRMLSVSSWSVFIFHFFKSSSYSSYSPFAETALSVITCLSQHHKAHLLAVFLSPLFSIPPHPLFLFLVLFLSFLFFFSFFKSLLPAPGEGWFCLEHPLVNSTSSLSVHLPRAPLTLPASIAFTENHSPPSPFPVSLWT